jgi:hypothetical protein
MVNATVTTVSWITVKVEPVAVRVGGQLVKEQMDISLSPKVHVVMGTGNWSPTINREAIWSND